MIYAIGDTVPDVCHAASFILEGRVQEQCAEGSLSNCNGYIVRRRVESPGLGLV